MLRAALDLGSNTFLMTVAEVGPSEIEVVSDQQEFVRLGQGVDQTGEFHLEALKRVDQCFEKFQALIQRLQVKEVLAVATSAARDAKNRNDFFALAKKWNIPVRIIPGELEAQLTFSGAVSADYDNTMVIDIGGGSTEYVTSLQNKIVCQSLDIGSVRLMEKFISEQPIPNDDLNRLESFVKNQLGSLKDDISKLRPEKIVAVAGTPTTLATLIEAISFDPKRIEGYQISIDQMNDWQKRLAQMSVKDRQQLSGMEPKRADVIVAGLTILLLSMRHFELKHLSVSCRGVRHGLLSNWNEVLSIPSPY